MVQDAVQGPGHCLGVITLLSEQWNYVVWLSIPRKLSMDGRYVRWVVQAHMSAMSWCWYTIELLRYDAIVRNLYRVAIAIVYL